MAIFKRSKKAFLIFWASYLCLYHKYDLKLHLSLYYKYGLKIFLNKLFSLLLGIYIFIVNMA